MTRHILRSRHNPGARSEQGGSDSLLSRLASYPIFNRVAFAETVSDHIGRRHPVADHETHAAAAVDWLVRAQDATPDHGFSRGFSLIYSPYFGTSGWQPSYPETTGYIIPTLYMAAEFFARPELRRRALHAADWEIEVALPDGSVRAGVMGEGTAPAIFNTGQVLFGWVKCLEDTGDDRYAQALGRAGRFLVGAQDEDGLWRNGNSPMADAAATIYNARVAWGLAEAGRILDDRGIMEAAAKNLRAVVERQRANGWFPDCCLNDPRRPLLHTIAYTIRGLIEGGRVLEDDSILESGMKAAAAVRSTVRDDGFMAGRFTPDWKDAARWSCLTGQAQMTNIWIRLYQVTGDETWIQPVDRVLSCLKSTQNLGTRTAGLRGGIKGSFPVNGGYGRYEVLNWATKFFADALMRHSWTSDGAIERAGAHVLA